jgi:hypothetical protein
VRWSDRFRGLNFRGRRVPRVLGVGIATGTAFTLALRGIVGGGLSADELVAAAAAGLVFLAGLVDDLVPSGPRGIRNHLRELAAGRMTTGILKLVVTAGATIVVVASAAYRSWPIAAAAVVLVMGTTNLWNGLDVRPGRALKFFLVMWLALVAVAPPAGPDVAVLRSMWPWAALALLPDLRERAMLGDAGANVLGFTVGLGLLRVAPPWWVLVLAVAVLALNVLADTFTLSRAIEAAPPLRWFDRLGRPPEGPAAAAAADPSEG